MKIIAALFLLVVVAHCAPLLHANSPTAINGSYIVVLQEGSGVALRDAHIQQLMATIAAKNDNSEIGFKFDIGSFIGFSAKLSDAFLQIELSHPDVQYVELDQVVSIVHEVNAPDVVITQTGATWGISRVSSQAKASWTAKTTYKYPSDAGAGVNVYVIDTGILITHVDFGGRATAGHNSITNEANTDLNGHGTHCAGTIGGTTYGVAKKVNLIGVKVLSASGSGSTAGVVAGVDWTTKEHARLGVGSVASMSLGGGASDAMDRAVAASITAGVVYSIAAGNSNANACNYSPAKVATAVTVGSTDSTDARSSFSNIGACVTLFAPGSSITSDWIGSNTATSTISGTSMACPHVSGVLALKIASDPETLTPAQLKTWIKDVATVGTVTNPGTNSPNLFLYNDYAAL